MNAKFIEGTKLSKCFMVLSDCKWHCGKHELPGTQSAGLIRELVNRGFKVEKASKFCRVCNEDTTHRQLKG